MASRPVYVKLDGEKQEVERGAENRIKANHL
jgi:hypothetical protein